MAACASVWEENFTKAQPGREGGGGEELKGVEGGEQRGDRVLDCCS